MGYTTIRKPGPLGYPARHGNNGHALAKVALHGVSLGLGFRAWRITNTIP